MVEQLIKDLSKKIDLISQKFDISCDSINSDLSTIISIIDNKKRPVNIRTCPVCATNSRDPLDQCGVCQINSCCSCCSCECEICGLIICAKCENTSMPLCQVCFGCPLCHTIPKCKYCDSCHNNIYWKFQPHKQIELDRKCLALYLSDSDAMDLPSVLINTVANYCINLKPN